MSDLFVSAFVTLFVVIDPPGCAPIFAGLTSRASAAQARAMAVRACLIATAILILFALFGEQLLGALHIELNSFRLAGGVMLFLIALEMVFEKRTERREERVGRLQHGDAGAGGSGAGGAGVEDVSVFPMAMPMLAGPGSIASVMLLTARAQGTSDTLLVLAALVAVMALSLLALVAARPLIRLLGTQVEAVITRLLGVVLAALAAQYVIDAVRAVMAG